MVDRLRRHLQYALRSLRRSPLFTVIVVGTLALGTGANAAIFSLVNQVLMRPLPVAAPEALVNVLSPGPRSGRVSSGDGGGVDAVFSYPLFRDLERVQTPFTGIAAHRQFDANIAYRNEARAEQPFLISGSYFPVLGLRPQIGRLIGPDDDRVVGGQPVAVLSDAYWRSRFGGDPGVIGRTVLVNAHPLTIVGVAPAGFEGTVLGKTPPMFIPLTMTEVLVPHSLGLANRRDHWLYLLARLKPGHSPATAEQQLAGPFTALLREVELPAQRGMSAPVRERFLARQLRLEAGSQGQRPQRETLRPMLTLLLVVSAMVLAIACANISNLMLARAAERSGDLTVRLSLGATRGQIITGLLTECALLAGVGTLAGIAVAALTLRAVGAVMTDDSRALFAFRFDGAVFLFAIGLAVVTTMLVGLYPAVSAARRDLAGALKGAKAVSGGRGAARARTTLVTAQIALSMALLAVAGLFARSLVNMSHVDLGVQVSQRLVFRLSPELNGYAPVRSQALFDRVIAEIEAVPGVQQVTAAREPLLSGDRSGQNVTVEGFTPPTPDDAVADYALVGAKYFGTVGIPLIAGREFTTDDTAGRAKVVVVNELFARKFKLGANPVGRRMALGGVAPGKLDLQIVGMVRDARYSQLKEPALPQFFLPYRQDADLGVLNFYVRYGGSAEGIMRAIPTIVGRIDPALPVEGLRLLADQAWETAATDRVVTRLAAWFGALATLLAALGLYGVLSYSVTQRTREIGLRMALGAEARQVRAMVLGHVGRMLVAGTIGGVALALALGRLTDRILYGVSGAEPIVIALAVMAMVMVAMIAGALPARRAARVEPVQALRYE